MAASCGPHDWKLLKNGTMNRRIALLRLLCTCILFLSGYPSCYSLVYGPFPDSDISIHEDTLNNKLHFRWGEQGRQSESGILISAQPSPADKTIFPKHKNPEEYAKQTLRRSACFQEHVSVFCPGNGSAVMRNGHLSGIFPDFRPDGRAICRCLASQPASSVKNNFPVLISGSFEAHSDLFPVALSVSEMVEQFIRTKESAGDGFQVWPEIAGDIPAQYKG